MAAAAVVLLVVAGVSSVTLVTVGAAIACPLVMVLMTRHQDHAGDERQRGEAK